MLSAASDAMAKRVFRRSLQPSRFYVEDRVVAVNDFGDSDPTYIRRVNPIPARLTALSSGEVPETFRLETRTMFKMVFEAGASVPIESRVFDQPTSRTFQVIGEERAASSRVYADYRILVEVTGG